MSSGRTGGRARVLAFSRCKQAGRPVVWARVTCELVRARPCARALPFCLFTAACSLPVECERRHVMPRRPEKKQQKLLAWASCYCFAGARRTCACENSLFKCRIMTLRLYNYWCMGGNHYGRILTKLLDGFLSRVTLTRLDELQYNLSLGGTTKGTRVIHLYKK